MSRRHFFSHTRYGSARGVASDKFLSSGRGSFLISFAAAFKLAAFPSPLTTLYYLRHTRDGILRRSQEALRYPAGVRSRSLTLSCHARLSLCHSTVATPRATHTLVRHAAGTEGKQASGRACLRLVLNTPRPSPLTFDRPTATLRRYLTHFFEQVNYEPLREFCQVRRGAHHTSPPKRIGRVASVRAVAAVIYEKTRTSTQTTQRRHTVSRARCLLFGARTGLTYLPGNFPRLARRLWSTARAPCSSAELGSPASSRRRFP
jgi:hypothetical protein